jgi:hypothetical protein
VDGLEAVTAGMGVEQRQLLAASMRSMAPPWRTRSSVSSMSSTIEMGGVA